jgi:hypothetical protein
VGPAFIESQVLRLLINLVLGGGWVVLMCGFAGRSTLQWAGSKDRGSIPPWNNFSLH